MKKVGIITIYDNNNYGNRLQNYATQTVIEKLDKNTIVETIKNKANLNIKRNIFTYNLRKIKNIYTEIKNNNQRDKNRKKYFYKFNKNIHFNKYTFDYYKLNKFKYDYYIVGSDQVWNLNYRFGGLDLVDFCESKNKIAFSASLGIAELPMHINKSKVSKELNKFKQISVRENEGKEIIENLTNRYDVEVLVDPTMLLTAEDWNKVIKKPDQFNNLKRERYILNYFLGNMSESRKKEIDRIAKENDCQIINILDRNNPFYKTGPSEFLYLEKNAFLICTDSFHSCVFAILYNVPFVVFNREQTGISNMNSRIETLLSKFELKNRRFEGNFTKENLNCDYTQTYEILEYEKKRALKFLSKALDLI